MKIKHLKTGIIPTSFLAALILSGLAAILPIATSKVEAKISYSAYVKKLPDNACKSLRGSDRQFQDQCENFYKKGAADVYFSGKKYAQAQAAQQCATSTDFTCTAYSAGMGDGITILDQSGGSDGGGGNHPPSGGQPQPPQPTVNYPPISDCNKADTKSDIKKCKQAYRSCIRVPYSPQKIADCEQQKIDQYTKNPSKKKHKKPPNPVPGNVSGTHQCGNMPDDGDNYKTKFDFGCLGSKGPVGLGPIQDLIFALVRFASIGVGIAVTLAVIAAGIQYSMAEGNPESSHKAKVRAREALIGLMIYIFAFSLLQFLIPGGMFK